MLLISVHCGNMPVPVPLLSRKVWLPDSDHLLLVVS